MPMVHGMLQFPTLGFEPGFPSLATRSPREFRLSPTMRRRVGLRGVTIPGIDFTVPTSVSEFSDMSTLNKGLLIGGAALFGWLVWPRGGRRRR